MGSAYLLDVTLAVAEALNPNKPNQTAYLPWRYNSFLDITKSLWISLILGRYLQLFADIIKYLVISRNELEITKSEYRPMLKRLAIETEGTKPGIMHRGEIHIFPEIAERDRTPPFGTPRAFPAFRQLRKYDDGKSSFHFQTHELVPKVILSLTPIPNWP